MKVMEIGNKVSGLSEKLEIVEEFEKIDFKKSNKYFLDISKGKDQSYEVGKLSAESGKSVISSLKYALKLLRKRKLTQSFWTFNKTSMKLAGNNYPDELHLMANDLGVKKFFLRI